MQPVVLQVAPSRGTGCTVYNSRASCGLGGAQVAVGLLCVILNVAGLLSPYSYFLPLIFIGHGIWAGAFFIVTGSIGIGAGCTTKRCLIITFMVLSILCASLFVPAMVAVDVSSLIFVEHWARHEFTGSQLAEGLHGGLLALALIELILAICSSVLCCYAVCGCCGNTARREGQVAYIQNMEGTHQVIIIPQGQGMQGGLIPQGQGMQGGTPQYVIQPAGVVQNTPTVGSYPECAPGTASLGYIPDHQEKQPLVP